MEFKPDYNRMKSKTALIFLMVWFSLGFLSPSYAQAPGQTKPKKEDYNVVLIIIDTLRVDHLGCYGYPKDTSPAIDKIAQDSVLFENTFSNAGHTLPSTMSILTSLYPSSHGMKVIYKDKLSRYVDTLAEILQAYEYQTAWFSLLKEPHLDIDIGFGRGFQDKVELSLQFEGREKLLDWLKTNQKNKFFLAIDARQVHHFLWFQQPRVLKGISAQDRQTLYDEANKEVELFYGKLMELARSGKPPFDDLKLIIDNPELFNGVFSLEKIDPIRALVRGENRRILAGLSFNLYIFLMDKVASKNTKAYIAAYDAAIQAVDTELIKPIYEQLKASGVYDKTIIVITSDHGEGFDEHGYYGHGPLYPEINRVPLIIKMPYAKENKKTKELAQGIDILPTVLDLAGIEKPHQAQGRSLINLMTGKDTLGPNKYVFAESLGRTSMRSKEWKIELPDQDDVAKHGPKELFHLTVDPQEHKNLYSLEPKVAARLEAELKQWKAALPSYGEDHPFNPGVDAAAQERIKKTGYF